MFSHCYGIHGELNLRPILARESGIKSHPTSMEVQRCFYKFSPAYRLNHSYDCLRVSPSWYSRSFAGTREHHSPGLERHTFGVSSIYCGSDSGCNVLDRMVVYFVEVSTILHIHGDKANRYLVLLSCGNPMRIIIHTARLPTIVLIDRPQEDSQRQIRDLFKISGKFGMARENGKISGIKIGVLDRT